MRKSSSISIIGSFETQNEIEFGAYGLINIAMNRSNVYLANHKLYAMKIENRWKSEEYMKFMESEIEVLSWIFPYKLHSDYYFENDHNVYIIIDYCENGDLLKEIENKSKINQHFEEDEIWKYFIEICFGLEFLNSRGFIHHDLHPKNIFLDKNKDVKLGDFGISNYIDNKKDRSFFSIFFKKDKKKEGDVWAAGCVLYYLLTLKSPFEWNLKKEDNYKLITANYSDEINYLANWCLRKKIKDRPKITQILTHEFIINKTINLDITVPQKSVMRTIYNPIEEINETIPPQIEIPLLKSYTKTSAQAQNAENTKITIQESKEKTAEILNRSIDPELEQEFRRICSIYESNKSFYDSPLINSYQKYVNTYNHWASLHKIVKNKKETHLVTYNTETEKKEIKLLKTSEELDYHASIAKLPDGKLFCFSNVNLSGNALIIDENGRSERQPSGNKKVIAIYLLNI